MYRKSEEVRSSIMPPKNVLKIKEDNHEKEIRQAYYPPGQLGKMQQRANNSNRERQSTSSLL